MSFLGQSSFGISLTLMKSDLSWMGLMVSAQTPGHSIISHHYLKNHGKTYLGIYTNKNMKVCSKQFSKKHFQQRQED